MKYGVGVVLWLRFFRYGNVYPGIGSETDIGEGDGKGYTINVPLEGGKYGNADYIVIWEKLLLPIADKFKPDIILISAGFDSAEYLPLLWIFVRLPHLCSGIRTICSFGIFFFGLKSFTHSC